MRFGQLKLATGCWLVAGSLLAAPASQPGWPAEWKMPTSRPVFDIPKLANITADGKAGDWGDTGFRVDAMAMRDGKPAPTPFAPRFRLAWTEKGLWVLATVRDAVARADKVWPLGLVEIVLAVRVGSPVYYRCVLTPGDAAPTAVRYDDCRVAMFYDPRIQREELRDALVVEAASLRTGDGYALEAFLPWKNLGLDPKLGDEIGCSVSVYSGVAEVPQGVKAKPRPLEAIWYPVGWAARDSGKLHRLRLAASASPAVTAPELPEKYAGLGAAPSAGVHHGDQCSIYVPPGLKRVRGVYVTWPGYGSSMSVDPARRMSYALHANRAFVEKMGFALMGMTYIADKSTPDSPATQRVLDALKEFAVKTGHPELEHAPLIVDGFSQGSNLTLCNLVAKIPERIIAFGAFGYVNPEWPVSDESRKVPGVLHCGEKDQHFARYKAVFAANRPKGAPWSLTLAPGLGHTYGDCQHLALPFYVSMIALRMPEQADHAGPIRLKDVDLARGWLGDSATLAISPAAEFRGKAGESCWFPDRYTAFIWQRLSRGQAITMQTLRDAALPR